MEWGLQQHSFSYDTPFNPEGSCLGLVEDIKLMGCPCTATTAPGQERGMPFLESSLCWEFKWTRPILGAPRARTPLALPWPQHWLPRARGWEANTGISSVSFPFGWAHASGMAKAEPCKHAQECPKSQRGSRKPRLRVTTGYAEDPFGFGSAILGKLQEPLQGLYSDACPFRSATSAWGFLSIVPLFQGCLCLHECSF